MRQSGQPLGDRPEAIEPQGVHRQASEGGHDLHAVGLAVTVCVFPQLGVAGPVPGVLDRPAITHVLQQGLCAGAQTRDVVTDLIDRFAITGACPVSIRLKGGVNLVDR